MCGISGIFTKSQNYSRIEKLLNLSLQKLTNRGPDDEGIEKFQINEGNLLLGHARLSIIDLSKNGHQPMTSESGRYVVTFNGEIYNYLELRETLTNYGYIFKTNTDTEVLLNSWDFWGKESISKFKGMFAFAIYDLKKKELNLVRDSFGIKPIYYKLDKNFQFLSFSSELPSLLILSEEKTTLNKQATFDYLIGKSYDLSQDTFFEECKSLLPGQLIHFDLNDLRNFKQIQWWHPKVAEEKYICFNSAKEIIREKFLSNIKYHMRSDVPIGATLSGGIDSSSVVCAMRYLEPKLDINTFTYLAKDNNYNEEFWADEINNFVGAIPHKISIDNNKLISELDDLIALQGAPFNSSSAYAQYKVYEMIRQTKIKVVLDGQGADEILAGYDYYIGFRIRSLLASGKYIASANLLTNWSNKSLRSKRSILMNLISSFSTNKLMNGGKSFVRKYITPVIENKWFKDNGIINLSDYDLFEFNCENPNERALIIELAKSISTKGLSHLLRHLDRNSMHWSIESRVPFLSNDFVDFCFKLPEEFLISNEGESKYIFREAMRGIVPNKILDRREKIGFFTPENQIIKDLLPSFRKEINNYFDLPFLNKKYLNSVKDNNIKISSNLWRLIIFCKWYKIFMPSI